MEGTNGSPGGWTASMHMARKHANATVPCHLRPSTLAVQRNTMPV